MSNHPRDEFTEEKPTPEFPAETGPGLTPFAHDGAEFVSAGEADRTVSDSDLSDHPELLDHLVSSEEEPLDFPVVGVGASAGGLESLERMFRAMPSKPGMAFVVIQHLSPNFKSLMDELLARYTALRIHRAEHRMQVEPNAIYLIPPRKEMIISNRRLLLTDKDPAQPLSMPIDRFFRSLAQDAGRLAVGVILSGSGSDGSRGVREIHAAGGLIICESEETAKFDGMPLATLGTGDVDVVVAPEQIPSVLERHARQLLKAESMIPDAGGETVGVNAVFKLLNDHYGIDFHHYKPNTVLRRIQRRLSITHALSLSDYAERLRSDPKELNALYQDLLIGVTMFFRDPDAFEQIEKVVVPKLIDQCAEDEIRIWVPGCATGEEAYSLAILLHEEQERRGLDGCTKILATDMHRASLDFAAAGIYSEDSVSAVSPQRLSRYFDRKHDGYHVIPELRQMLVFAAHNVIKDAPFTKLDLVSCRNLLIYFRPPAQKKAISLFHFGLKAGGLLFLGPSETPGDLANEFEAVNSHWKIYKKSRDVRLPVDLRGSTPGNFLRPVATSTLPPVRGWPDPSLIGAYDAVLAKHMPPGFLINEHRELLHVFGDAGRFFRVRTGRPSPDVLDCLEDDLRTAVIGAVQRVLKEHRTVRFQRVKARTGRGEELLDISIEPVDNARSRLLQLLILIQPSDPKLLAIPSATGHEVDEQSRKLTRDRIEALEQQLRHSDENLSATIEELQTSNEEMQATNEELVAANEELQSTNEELQSVNQELFSVNAEYQRKIVELSELTADMDNLLSSTDIGTIFLDRDLNIRKFTPMISEAFNLLPQDVGRPITGFAYSILHQGLMEDLGQVLKTEKPMLREVQDQHGKALFLRILPYRAKNRVEGVVMTLVDVSTLKEAERKLSEAVRLRDEFLAMLSHELRNPLGAIQSAGSVLAMKPPSDPEVRQACDVIRRQAAHLSRLLDDLLDVSRVTQRKIELRRRTVDVTIAIQQAIESVQPLFAAGEIDFRDESRLNGPILVNGDLARLQQAVSNVLANAAKYTPPGGQVVMQVHGSPEEVGISIRDTGVGIAADKLETIFDLFVQSESTLHRSSGGMGIGLTLARSIIELHGGGIRALSQGPGEGSEFEIRLPCAKDATFSQTMPEPPRRPSGSYSCRVVVVEDGGDAREMMEMLLRVYGCTVQSAPDGVDGLELIERERPDVALIDIGLPRMSGYEIARRLRSNPANGEVYIVALTGYGRPSDVKEALDAGFDNHLVKPLDLTRLLRILEFRVSKDAPHAPPEDSSSDDQSS